MISLEIFMQWAKNILKRTSFTSLSKQHRAQMAQAQVTAVERQSFGFYSQFVSPGSLCFDVGANVGAPRKNISRIGSKGSGGRTSGPMCSASCERITALTSA